MELLHELSGEYQVILFTREDDVLERCSNGRRTTSLLTATRSFHSAHPEPITY